MVYGGWVCLLAPLAGFLAILLAGTRITRRQAGLVSTLSVFVGFGGAIVALVDALGRDPDERVELTTAWTWLQAGDFEVGLELLIDPLSLVMMLVVTGVGGLIVAYSNGYMAGDDEERRYFAYMSFFVFSMLMLVQGGNLLMLLIGWGLVGLASYLLIGFHHERRSAVEAAKKAFVMNALGDAVMALGFFLVIFHVGSLDYGVVFDAAESGELSKTVVTLVALGLLGGAVAKSAQIPFHTWLPDAMEGPTPVSALIHAATMVTAGVYLICRTHPVFEAAPEIQHLAAILGLVTLLVAGVVALVQWDIKRVIAYSTMSQIGYMFVGAGIGAYGFAMFHLVTHAFFKALLFLAAGLVIHHLGGEQDIRKMGGLRSSMPFTRWMFLIGTVALVGIPPFAGFWSKDAILASALAEGGALGWILFVGGLLGTLLTGMYALRLYFLVFHGKSHEAAHAPEAHAHHGEGSGWMTLPVGVLGLGSAIVGLLLIPGVWDPVEDWLEPVVEPLVHPTTGQEWLTSAIAVGLGALGALLAWRSFESRRELVRDGAVRTTLEHKLWFDELYDAVFARPARGLAVWLRDRVETPVVQGGLDEVADGTLDVAGVAARAQSGLLRTYALAITVTVSILALVFLVVR
ncbi:MAG TPA: NADH-quinone oxidoreductase subunit L [Gaiella sp.]|nr:NADH-quinone oxidoreductase subunit L [Gaiella sp.]